MLMFTRNYFLFIFLAQCPTYCNIDNKIKFWATKPCQVMKPAESLIFCSSQLHVY